MILHIPHASDVIPIGLRGQIVLSDEDLTAELLRMTDAFTNELFDYPGATKMQFPISRLLVEVERFPDDTKEPMSKVGMGIIYTRTAHGKKLKRELLAQEKRDLITRYYETHHQTLLAEVKNELEKDGKALIVDCHSFPNQPLPCDRDQSVPRPDFCIGTDSFHTPKALIQASVQSLKEKGDSVGINKPYEGTFVPLSFYKKDSRVTSIMIEVNRSLYMDELVGTKTSTFGSTQNQILTLLDSIREFEFGTFLKL